MCIIARLCHIDGIPLAKSFTCQMLAEAQLVRLIIRQLLRKSWYITAHDMCGHRSLKARLLEALLCAYRRCHALSIVYDFRNAPLKTTEHIISKHRSGLRCPEGHGLAVCGSIPSRGRGRVHWPMSRALHIKASKERLPLDEVSRKLAML